MAEVIEATGKTVEAALRQALETLDVEAADVEYEVLEKPSRGLFGLIGVKPARIRVRKKAVSGAETPSHQAVEERTAAEETQAPSALDPGQAGDQVQRAIKFLQDVFSAMNLTVALTRRDTEDGVLFCLDGENLGVLIGKHGQTLDALQYLTNLAANRGISEDRVRIVLDVENYRSRREETLSRLAGHLAEKACRIGQEVHLEPMNRHERKIIHMALQDNRRVITYSAGDEPRRYVVIAPKRRRRRDFSRGEQQED